MSRSEGARAATKAASAAQRLIKDLRDGARGPGEIAREIVAVRDVASYKAISNATRRLNVSSWTPILWLESAEEVARLSTLWRAPAEEHLDPHEDPTPAVREPTLSGVARSDRPARMARKAGVAAARAIKTMTVDQVLTIHYALVDEFADDEDPIFPPGVKNEHLLQSAVSRQFTSLGGEPKYKSVTDVAGTLMYGLAMNHPFHNGNKRTALVAMIVLMDTNGLAVTASEEELFDFVLEVAEHALRPDQGVRGAEAADAEVRGIATWLRTKSRSKGHVHPSITWRELKRLLKAHACELGTTDGSQLEIVRADRRTVLAFDGDTKEVDRGAIRKLRADLGLTDSDGYDSDVFFGYALPLDAFIMKHRTVLRRLAHA